VEERAAHLDASCAGDEALRAEVESLLRYHDADDTAFLEPPRMEVDPNGDILKLIGRRAGQCTIEGVLASGGMGAVYIAHQPSLARKVAIKVLRPGTFAGTAPQRFEHEARVLASLKHPHLAHVFDAGTLDGPAGKLPYFAMELVEAASTIIGFARANGLDVERRVRLFLQACDAVQYAHSKGIIHRDLKPSNILVDALGNVRVIDFGIARNTDVDVARTTIQTETGRLLGTLQYMSPEQCDANPHELDVRTDVYSLGVVLYELLANELPYDVSTATVFRATQIIKTVEPTIRDGSSGLRGDLRWIALKSISKDRDGRYRSVGELADELRRFLNGEPILARPPNWRTHLVKWQRRRPLAFTAITAALIALVIIGVAAITAHQTMRRATAASLRPSRVQLSPDGRIAEVISTLENPTHVWQTSVPDGIEFAELVAPIGDRTGTKQALLGFAVNADGACAQNAGALCLFDLNKPEAKLIWEARVTAEQIRRGPLDYRDEAERNFGLRMAARAEVFSGPQNPGLETIAVFSHLFYDARIIMVIDLHGQTLFSAWHRGGVGPFIWSPQHRQMVSIGQDGHATWNQRGIQGLKLIKPRIVFGLHFTRETEISNWLRPSEPSHGVAWYKVIMPAAGVDRAKEIDVEKPEDPAAAARICLRFPNGQDAPIGFSWNVDEKGELIEDSYIVSDRYKIWLKDAESAFPDPKNFRLEDLPPITAK
jgi:serine/threonine protein kinase